MRNKVGPPVSGEDFYPRPLLMASLCRRLNSGDHLYLQAPRRSGKTSIMFQLREEPCDGYIFVYINTESVEDPEHFFVRVLKEIERSGLIANRLDRLTQARNMLDDLLQRIRKIGPVELNDVKGQEPSALFSELLAKLDLENERLVLMIDEFPSTVANIVKKHGADAAVRFLQLNRSLRQNPGSKIQMMYTGSIGLPALVSSLEASAAVNDLANFEVPPLTREEAAGLCSQLFEREKIALSPALTEHLLDQVGWLMPFFVQLAVGETIEVYYTQRSTVLTENHINEAIERSTSLRSNTHFESYYQRITTAFNSEEASFAHQILRRVANEESIPIAEALGQGEEANRRRFVLNSLELDGYLYQGDGQLRFQSPILRKWWQRFAY